MGRNKPFPFQVAFDHGVYHSSGKQTRMAASTVESCGTDTPVLFWGVTDVLGSLVWKSCCGSELSELFCGNMEGGLTCEVGEPLRITVVCGTF